jgi:type II secretory pathway predicted ATPase ExeA
MYQTYWGLRESPFQGRLDPRFFYQSPTHEEALARLQFLVDQRRRLGLLVGPSGSGKSLLFEVLAGQLRRASRQVAKLSLLGITPSELLWRMASSWGVSLNPTPSIARLWRAVTDRLIENRYQQIATIVLLDDADQADPQALQHVTRLAGFDPSPDQRLTIVLASRNDGMATLGNRLLEMADLRIDVGPWEQADTEGFLQTSLAHVGRATNVFNGPAVTRLHELSRGIPRRVSQLADLSLLAGAGASLQQIDVDLVDSVSRELAI